MLQKIGVVLLLVVIAFGFGYCSNHQLLPGTLVKNETNITNDIVVKQIQAVAKLVSSEASVESIIMYENSWYGSTKKSLVVVTGRLLAGIDMGNSPTVAIDHERKKIMIRIPQARLIAVEIRNMQTYDEQNGLWNTFTPKDRDAIYLQGMNQLKIAGKRLELLNHANESAIAHLRAFLARDGYAVDVAIRGK